MHPIAVSRGMDIRPAALLACFLAAPTLVQAAEGIAWRAFADGSACHMESASGPRLLRISAQASLSDTPASTANGGLDMMSAQRTSPSVR